MTQTPATDLSFKHFMNASGTNKVEIPLTLREGSIRLDNPNTYSKNDCVFFEGEDDFESKIFYHRRNDVVGFIQWWSDSPVTLTAPVAMKLFSFIKRKFSEGGGYVEWVRDVRMEHEKLLNTFVIARTKELVLE